MISRKKLSIKKEHIIFIGMLFFLVGLSLLFYFFNPSEIIELIGVKNGYLIIALFALFGGFSAFTSFSFYTTVIAFTIGGLNPFFVALVATPSLFIGDIVYYYFGNALNKVLTPRMQKLIEKVTNILHRPLAYKFSPILIYLYVGISPLPPDVLIVALSIADYPFNRMIVPLLLGEITFVFLVSIFAQQGIRLFGF